MKASFVDLRKKSSEIIQALSRNERVTVLYRGKPAAVMQPIGEAEAQPATEAKEHPAFGIWKDRPSVEGDVAAHVRRLRKGRFDAL